MMMEKRRLQGIARRGIDTREGVPDGMRKWQAAPLNEAARQSAKETMSKLEKAGVLVDDSEDAKEALQSAITSMRQPGSKQVGLAAAKLVLEYTKAKPASKSDITVNKAEEWLAAIAADNGKQGDASTDA
jgi:phosphoribosylpyrophosphate synthetase